MEEKPNNPTNQENKGGKKPYKKPYYKKRYNQGPPKKKSFWNADKIVSLSAMAIALFTLAVLLYQSNILERQYELTVEQQKASVLPYLQLGPSFSAGRYTITVSNKGVGPAFINGFYVKKADSIISIYDLVSYYDNFSSKKRSFACEFASLYKGCVIAPGEEIELLNVIGDQIDVDLIGNFFNKYMYNSTGSMKLMIDYRSTFNDAWVLETTFPPQPISKEEYGNFDFLDIHSLY
ncbi:hypothetical protein GCM10011506_26610 [Marivirga lumbricoides]|uniref:Uncharacterized protein n=1 Tax=Marivirga lumbricoides TaxID=1046115 RepID=A0ABQ1MFT4_9BACT|nr:hypothetical protein GCM10011506_26610 [Marivirga lumbricoides]